jgi:adenosine deaminase
MELDYRAVQKEDLHVHLNGAVPSSTFKRLVEQNKIAIPDAFNIDEHLNILQPVDVYEHYFLPWNLFRLLPVTKDCLKNMVHDCLEAMVKDNVQYAELRHSVLNIAALNSISLSEAISWLGESIEDACRTLPINAKLIISLDRNGLTLDRGKQLLEALSHSEYKQTVVGLDLTGNENISIPKEISSVFRKGKDDYGLGITIHAGERGHIDHIYWAMNDCLADRIGHGLAAAKSPELLMKLAEKGICMEVCLSANLRTSTDWQTIICRAYGSSCSAFKQYARWIDPDFLGLSSGGALLRTIRQHVRYRSCSGNNYRVYRWS